MKNLSIITLILGSLLLGSPFANATGNSKNTGTKTKMVSCTDQMEQIISLVGKPSVIHNDSEKVEVKFTITEHNVIEVTEINSSNATLVSFIKAQLNGKRINGNDVEVKNQSLNFIFKNQKNIVYTVF